MKIKYSDIPKIKKDLIKSQKNRCVICKRNLKLLPSREVCLDHNHKTGKIRAVLCRGCNSMEGKVWKAFVRMGLRNQNVEYFDFLIGLAHYYMEHEVLELNNTDYIHPKFKVKNDKPRKHNS